MTIEQILQLGSMGFTKDDITAMLSSHIDDSTNVATNEAATEAVNEATNEATNEAATEAANEVNNTIIGLQNEIASLKNAIHANNIKTISVNNNDNNINVDDFLLKLLN